METLIIFAYLAWACYSGYKVLTGRSEWLDRKSPINIICKLTLSAAVGCVIGAFYLIYLVLKFLGFMAKL